MTEELMVRGRLAGQWRRCIAGDQRCRARQALGATVVRAVRMRMNWNCGRVAVRVMVGCGELKGGRRRRRINRILSRRRHNRVVMMSRCMQLMMRTGERYIRTECGQIAVVAVVVTALHGDVRHAAAIALQHWTLRFGSLDLDLFVWRRVAELVFAILR